MNPFVEPNDAASVLAVAAYKMVQQWTDGDVADAVRGLSDAIDYFSNARAAVLPDLAHSAPQSPNTSLRIEPPRRFAAALRMIDPRAQNVVTFANGILSACSEVVLEKTMPTKDPGVRLLAAHLAWVCNVGGNADFPDLIGECHRRSKT